MAAAAKDADANAGSDNVGDPVHPCSKPPDWIEIQLLDENGQPIPNEEYVVTLPDGTERRGNLGSNGWARVEPIPAGDCTVNFPNLDTGSWQYDRSKGPGPSQT